MHRIPSKIYLYDGGKTESLNLGEISKYLQDSLRQVKVQIRDDFIIHCLSKFSSKEKEKIVGNLAKEIAGIKIQKIENKDVVFKPLLGEIEYEKKRISDPEKKSFGILYDGFKLRIFFSELIPKEESGFNHCHIIFTNQLFGTWDEEDLRYHARVSIFGFPSIISITGIVEAPAKPREFYLKKQMGIDVEALKKEFSGRFIDYDDPRLTEVMKGYVLQAILYHMSGEPFCNDKNCRLFNAHWQEEVIQAQLNSGYEFCSLHDRILR